MAGADYREVGISIEEWEAKDLEEIPAHLLAEEDSKDEEGWRGGGEVRRDNKYGGLRYPLLNSGKRHAKHTDGSDGDRNDNEHGLVTVKSNLNIGFYAAVDAVKVMVKAILRLQ